MRTTIGIEKIGDERPWVAHLRKRDDGIHRIFLRGLVDYALANKNGTRGVKYWFLLDEGEAYEIFRMASWKKEKRYFCIVERGEVIKLSAKELMEWLGEEVSRGNG